MSAQRNDLNIKKEKKMHDKTRIHRKTTTNYDQNACSRRTRTPDKCNAGGETMMLTWQGGVQRGNEERNELWISTGQYIYIYRGREATKEFLKWQEKKKLLGWGQAFLASDEVKIRTFHWPMGWYIQPMCYILHWDIPKYWGCSSLGFNITLLALLGHQELCRGRKISKGKKSPWVGWAF